MDYRRWQLVLRSQRQTNFRWRDAKNGLVSWRDRDETGDGIGRSLHPLPLAFPFPHRTLLRSISLGGRGGSRSRGRRRDIAHVHPAHARNETVGLLLVGHWSTLTRPPSRGTMRRGLLIVVYIYASRHKSSFKSHSAAMRWESDARASATHTHANAHIRTLVACERSARMVRHG